MLDADVLQVDAASIAGIAVCATFVAGRAVFAAENSPFSPLAREDAPDVRATPGLTATARQRLSLAAQHWDKAYAADLDEDRHHAA